jgi:hypothetical protein
VTCIGLLSASQQVRDKHGSDKLTRLIVDANHPSSRIVFFYIDQGRSCCLFGGNNRCLMIGELDWRYVFKYPSS